MRKYSYSFTWQIIVFLNICIHVNKVQGLLCWAFVLMQWHLISIYYREVNPIIVNKKFTSSPNIFQVLIYSFFSTWLLYLKAFVWVTQAYPILFHPIFYPSVRKNYFYYHPVFRWVSVQAIDHIKSCIEH